MSELWRCDVCHDLIDPVEEDERTQLVVELGRGDEKEVEAVDLCEVCRPSALGAHMDWMLHAMEGSNV